jgi:hypothetical protein
MKFMLAGMFAIALAGCANQPNAAAADRGPRVTAADTRTAYNAAYDLGRKAAKAAGKVDAGAKEKAIAAGLGHIKDLDASKIRIDVSKGIVYIRGQAKTQIERMRAEGYVYGFVGNAKGVRSLLEVPQ